MIKHIPEPWIAIEGGLYQDHSSEKFACKLPLYLGSMDSRSDAERIVACVNAMEGIPDPTTVQKMIEAAVKTERDRCARIAINWGYTYTGHKYQPFAAEFNRALRAQNAAIADKIKEGL